MFYDAVQLAPRALLLILARTRASGRLEARLNDGGFSAYVLPLGNVDENNGRPPYQGK